MTYQKTLDGSHQFRVPSNDGNTLSVRVNTEGIIIDLENQDGNVIQTAYQFWCDLEQLTH